MLALHVKMLTYRISLLMSWNAFGDVPDRGKAQRDLHELTLDKDFAARVCAIMARRYRCSG